MGLQHEFTKAHAGYKFRRFACTGQNCNFEAYAMETLKLECNTPGCGGTVKGREVISTRRYVLMLLEPFVNGQRLLNPALPADFRDITPNLRRQISKIDRSDTDAHPTGLKCVSTPNSEVEVEGFGDSHGE